MAYVQHLIHPAWRVQSAPPPSLIWPGVFVLSCPSPGLQRSQLAGCSQQFTARRAGTRRPWATLTVNPVKTLHEWNFLPQNCRSLSAPRGTSKSDVKEAMTHPETISAYSHQYKVDLGGNKDYFKWERRLRNVIPADFHDLWSGLSEAVVFSGSSGPHAACFHWEALELSSVLCYFKDTVVQRLTVKQRQCVREGLRDRALAAFTSAHSPTQASLTHTQRSHTTTCLDAALRLQFPWDSLTGRGRS